MTTISKILCVFVLTVSLGFLGVAAVTSVGGANWQVERDEVTGDYSFESTTSEATGTTYSVKARRGDRQLVQGAKSLAAAVISARKDMVTQQNAQITKLQEETQAAETEMAAWQGTVSVDEAAMTARCDELAQELATLNQQIDGISKKNIAKVEKTQGTLRKNEARREEVYRLLAQFDEIQTDLFQINEQQKRLRDLLTRKRGIVNRLKRRQVQLVRSGARGQYEDDPNSPPAKTAPQSTKKTKL